MAVARGVVTGGWDSVVARGVECWEVAMVEVAMAAEMAAVVTEGALEEGLAEETAVENQEAVGLVGVGSAEGMAAATAAEGRGGGGWVADLV